MRTINVTFTDREFRKLYAIKKRAWTWRAFIVAGSNLMKKLKGGKNVK